MKKRLSTLGLAPLLAAGVAQGALTYTFTEDATGVTVSYTGTLDLTGLAPVGGFSSFDETIVPAEFTQDLGGGISVTSGPVLALGVPENTTSTPLLVYENAFVTADMPDFGTAGAVFTPTSTSGFALSFSNVVNTDFGGAPTTDPNRISIDMRGDTSTAGVGSIDPNDVNGTNTLAGTAFFSGVTLADMGLTPGQADTVYTLNGAGDTITMTVPVPIPEPSTSVLAALAALGLIRRRR